MEDEAVEIMYSEESEASQLKLVKAIESWASKESQRSELELTGFGAALSNNLINFEKFSFYITINDLMLHTIKMYNLIFPMAVFDLF